MKEGRSDYGLVFASPLGKDKECILCNCASDYFQIWTVVYSACESCVDMFKQSFYFVV